MKTQFDIIPNPRSSHWVRVSVHTTTKAMRVALTQLEHRDSSHTSACCWQANDPVKYDMMVAEIHLPADNLTLDSIAHEAVHAAWHQAVTAGFIRGSVDFEEQMAYATGRITESIIRQLHKRKLKLLTH